jgi:6-phosphofructokinase
MTRVFTVVEQYTLVDPSIEIIGYVDGYKGLLKGQSVKFTPGTESSQTCHLVTTKSKNAA